MAEDRRIQVERSESLNLGIGEGNELLQAIKVNDLNKTMDLLPKELSRIMNLYGKEGNFTKAERQKWRAGRVKLYDKLLHLALGAVGNRWEDWEERTTDGKLAESADKKWFNKFESSFTAPTSIYKYLLDHIHENDDIMLKYYQIKYGQEDFKDSLTGSLWLKRSMEAYGMYLVDPARKWVKAKSSQTSLLEAKEELKERVSSIGESNRRNKARMYWLLSCAKGVSCILEELLAEDIEVLLEDNGGSQNDQPLKMKFADEKKVELGILKFPSLLAYASTKNALVLVACILKCKVRYETHRRYNRDWEKAWQTPWANALWNAAYKGHDRIVKELLNCTGLYSTEHYLNSEMEPPLHVAVRKEHVSVVEAFCTESFTQVNCHEVDCRFFQTPLQVATNLKSNDRTKIWRIQSFLLKRPEVKQAVEESYRQRDLIVNSANAIMVGAALIASVTFGGWLQPPLGYHPYYQFTNPLPAPPGSYDSYLSIQGHTSVRVFAIFNSLSFFFAIASALARIATFTAATIETLDERYTERTVKILLYSFRVTTSLFVVSVISVLIAFGSAAIAILPPIHVYRTDMHITIGVGGFFCIVFLGWMLFAGLSKRPENVIRRMYSKTKELFLNLGLTQKKIGSIDALSGETRSAAAAGQAGQGTG